MYCKWCYDASIRVLNEILKEYNNIIIYYSNPCNKKKWNYWLFYLCLLCTVEVPSTPGSEFIVKTPHYITVTDIFNDTITASTRENKSIKCQISHVDSSPVLHYKRLSKTGCYLHTAYSNNSDSLLTGKQKW